MSDRDWLHTDIGAVDADSITVRGLDLANDLMGKVTFTELAYLLVQGRAPTPQETALLDAVLVSLAEHGLTPTVLAARLTHTGAPESLQGAVASGLLGAGTVFLGVVEDTAVFLEPVVAAGDDGLARAAADAVRARIEAGGRIPGIGHPVGDQERIAPNDL
jgi:citrate synthase